MLEQTRQRPPSAIDSNMPSKRRKTVHFPSETSNLAQVTLIEDQPMTEEEKADVWYQPKDYNEIRVDIDATILELMQIEEDMSYWDTNKYTLRGLECRFARRYRHQRRNTQKTTVQMVLRAQKEYGHLGPEESQRRIQQVALMCSKAARARAQEVGALDQFAAGLGRPDTQPEDDTPMYSPTPEMDKPVPRRPSLLIAQPA